MFTDPRVQEFAQEKLRHYTGNARGTLSPAYPYGTMQGSLGYQAGNRLFDFADSHRVLKPLGSFASGLGHDDLSSVLMGAGAGAAIGAGSGLMSDRSEVGGRTAAGAGVGALSAFLLSKLVGYRDQQEAALRDQALHTKRAFYGMPGGPNPTQFIQTTLFHDNNLAPGDKSMLMGMLPNLNVAQAQSLSDALRGAVGASAGLIIARYFLKLGLGGQALMALVGGALSYGGLPRNAAGYRVNTRYDALGRQRLV